MERGREGGRQGYIYIERESGRGCWRAPENLAALCHESSFGDMRGVDDTTGILTIDKNNISTTMKKRRGGQAGEAWRGACGWGERRTRAFMQYRMVLQKGVAQQS